MRSHTGGSSPAELEVGAGGWIKTRSVGVPWAVSVRVAVVDGIPRLLGLRLDPDGALAKDVIISAVSLRRLPLRRLVQQAVDIQSMNLQDALLLNVDLNAKPGSPEHLQAVAAVYRRAVASGRHPRPLISERWGCSIRTVDDWIRRARDADPPLLLPGRKGKAGEVP